MGIKMDGKTLAESIAVELKNRCRYLNNNNVYPILTIVTTGDNAVNNIYLKNKIKRCEEIGIDIDVRHFDKLDRFSFFSEFANVKNPIIVEEPIAGDLTHNDVAEILKPYYDVDGASYANVAKLRLNANPWFVPCTPMGVMRLLKEYKIETEGANVLLIGRGNSVGYPLSILLEQSGATVTMAHSKTNRTALVNSFFGADIIVSAVGQKNILTKDELNEESFMGIDYILPLKVIVDVGTSYENGKLYGDFDDDMKSSCMFYTPTKGGIGPMTVISLCENVIRFYENFLV